MRIDRGLREVRAATVHMTAHPQSILESLTHAMFVRTSNIETDVTEANGVGARGAVPQLGRVRVPKGEGVT